MPSDTHKHAPFPRTANSPSRLNSVLTEQNSETEFKMAAPIVTVFIVLGPLCWLKWQFHSLVLLQYLTASVSLPMAYSLLILDRLVLCQCYRDNSFPGGVHVFLQRPSEIIKRLKCGRGVRSEIRVGSQRILERSICVALPTYGRTRTIK